jgi:hypothetical protein
LFLLVLTKALCCAGEELWFAAGCRPSILPSAACAAAWASEREAPPAGAGLLVQAENTRNKKDIKQMLKINDCALNIINKSSGNNNFYNYSVLAAIYMKPM